MTSPTEAALSTGMKRRPPLEAQAPAGQHRLAAELVTGQDDIVVKDPQYAHTPDCLTQEPPAAAGRTVPSRRGRARGRHGGAVNPSRPP